MKTATILSEAKQLFVIYPLFNNRQMFGYCLAINSHFLKEPEDLLEEAYRLMYQV